MAKIFNPPESILCPENCFEDGYEKEVKAFKAKLKAYCIEHGSGPDKGKILRYPVADGEAEYMILSYRPLQLVHLKVWDGWEYSPIYRFNAKEIKEDMRRQEAMDKLFSK